MESLGWQTSEFLYTIWLSQILHNASLYEQGHKGERKLKFKFTCNDDVFVNGGIVLHVHNLDIRHRWEFRFRPGTLLWYSLYRELDGFQNVWQVRVRGCGDITESQNLLLVSCSAWYSSVLPQACVRVMTSVGFPRETLWSEHINVSKQSEIF